MSPVGITNTIVASSVVDKVQNAQQLQIDIQQKQAEAQAVREQQIQRTTVNDSPEGEKVRMRKRGDQGKKKRRQQGQQAEENEENVDEELEDSAPKHINIKV